MDKSNPHHVKSAWPDMDRAIEVFVRGFCFTRSFTHPYIPERIGPVWVARDAPRRRGDYRNEEWIACGVAPEEINRIARRHTRGRFAVCAIHGADEANIPLSTQFKALGYRLGRMEPLMIHRLSRIPRMESSVAIERVATEELADQLAAAAGSRQVLPEYLSPDSPMRQYVARVDNELAGWVRSIVVEDATWCSDMHVKPSFRRRGIGRALLCRMLREDLANGATMSVLTASRAGAMLYPLVGYEQLGTLLLFTPRKAQ